MFFEYNFYVFNLLDYNEFLVLSFFMYLIIAVKNVSFSTDFVVITMKLYNSIMFFLLSMMTLRISFSSICWKNNGEKTKAQHKTYSHDSRICILKEKI